MNVYPGQAATKSLLRVNGHYPEHAHKVVLISSCIKDFTQGRGVEAPENYYVVGKFVTLPSLPLVNPLRHAGASRRRPAPEYP